MHKIQGIFAFLELDEAFSFCVIMAMQSLALNHKAWQGCAVELLLHHGCP